ncbi:cytochrome B pre-mRNA-processing protein 1 [Monosporozyma servazzii]
MFKLPLQRIRVAKFNTSTLVRQTAITVKAEPHELWEFSRSKLIDYIEANESVAPSSQLVGKDFSKMLQIYWSSIPSSPLLINNSSILSNIDYKKFISFTKQRWHYSPLIRSLFMRELIYNCNNIRVVNNLLILLEVKLPDPEITTPFDVLKWCINESVKKKDVITAIDLYLLYYKINVNLIPEWDYASTLISALKYQHPKYDNIHLKRLIEIIRLLQKHKIPLLFSNYDILLLCNKALSSDVDHLTSKTLLDMLLGSQLYFGNISNQTISKPELSVIKRNQLKLAYSLIDKDYEIRNQTGIHLTWIQIKDIFPSFSDHDSRILYKVFNSSCQNRAYRAVCVEMMGKMDPSSYCNDPLMIPSIIKYISITKSLEKARTLMADMEKYTTTENKKMIWSSRRFLSSLLRMQLVYFDAESVDRIIKQITETYGSLSSTDFEVIVSHLLSRPSMKNIKRTLQFVDSVPLDQRLSSYVVLLNKLTESVYSRDTEMKPLVMPLINEILVKAHVQDPEHRNRIWAVVSALYIKSILFPITSRRRTASNIDTSALDLAKLLYCKNKESHAAYNTTTVNPFTEVHSHNITLKITKNNRFVILRNIAHTSLKCSRQDIFRWSCTQLYKEGMPVEELILLWNITFKHQFRKSSYRSKAEIKLELTKHGINAFDKLLQ